MRVGGGDLGSDSGQTLGNDREGEADDVDSFFEEAAGQPPRTRKTSGATTCCG